MKNRYIKMLPFIGALAIFTMLQFYHIKTYYDEMIHAEEMIYEDFEQQLKEENEQAIEDEKEYQSMIDPLIREEEESGEEESTPLAKKLKLHAMSALLMDASNQRVLYEKNGYDEMPMASTTKIMTCIVALENSDLNEIVTISSYASGMPDVQLNAKAGDQYYLKDLLYSLMLESHNDIAVAIAEHVGGSVEGFATMMNDKARTLGCSNTNFITPNGLDAEGHYTTARDLAVIASYAISNAKFIEITNTSSHSFKEIKKGRTYTVTNKNRFLYMMEGAIGVKTGFTGDAGYCFVGAIKRSEKTLISVVLGCGWPPNKSLKWSDTKELMNYGVTYYHTKQIFEDINLKPVLVTDGQKKSEALSLEGDLSLLMRDDEAVKIVYDIPEQLQAPVKADSIAGYARYYINDMLYAELPIYTTEDILKIDFNFCLKKIIELWSVQ